MLPMDFFAADFLGYLAAAAVFLTFCMRTMLALRLIAIFSNVAFIAYALTADLVPILVLHGGLLPLNVLRLVQMQSQTSRAGRMAREAEAEENFEWLAQFARRRTFGHGALIFEQGDHADSLYVVLEGEVEIPEIGGKRSRQGALLGEIGLFSADRKRTASARAVGNVTLAQLTESRFKQLYFNNPSSRTGWGS